MADAHSPYQNLARNRLGVLGTGSLWLGPDHLLLVTNTFAVERYRRWFFKEIQILVARRTPRRMIVNFIFGIGGLLLALATAGLLSGYEAASEIDRGPLAVTAAIFAAMTLACLVVVIVNSALGPGCVVHVQTPRGLERLPLPARVRAYEKIAARLQPLIEAAQAAPETPAAPAPQEA